MLVCCAIAWFLANLFDFLCFKGNKPTKEEFKNNNRNRWFLKLSFFQPRIVFADICNKKFDRNDYFVIVGEENLKSRDIYYMSFSSKNHLNI